MKELIIKLIISIIVTVFLIIFGNYVKEPKTFHYITLLVILFIFFILLPKIINILDKIKIGLLRRFWPKIGILNGNIISPVREHKCERAWTNITTSMWFSELRRILKNKLLKTIKLISVSEIDKSYSIIINPFGDNFPEENTKLHTTFYKICDYIKSGGYFVCTGGVFYTHQNTIHSSSPEAVIIKTVNGVQSLKDTLLFLEFGVSTTGDNMPNEKQLVEVYQKDEDKNYIGAIIEKDEKVKRFRAAIKNTSDFIPILREKNDDSFPVVAVRYGEGYLVHFGLLLESLDSIEFRIVSTTIKNIIANKFKKF